MALPNQAQKMLDALSKLADGKPGEGEFYAVVKPYLNRNLFSLEGIAKLFAGSNVQGRSWTTAVEKHSQGLVLFFSPDNLAAVFGFIPTASLASVPIILIASSFLLFTVSSGISKIPP